MTVSGRAWNSAARARTGASATSMLSASTFLQSMQPQPALRQLTATNSTVAGGEKYLCSE